MFMQTTVPSDPKNQPEILPHPPMEPEVPAHQPAEPEVPVSPIPPEMPIEPIFMLGGSRYEYFPLRC